ncbi:hypothetical protein [Pseudomonas aeruginosa]|uniref:hypothetical protein n=1 Tax=Pseudomonas aeruginosa TaxID=287 RepID=UPI0022EBC1B4|nr:hypothetical protein [Pseudomonas aeruginosa]HBN9641696.1 hypothetical protein [Pseudomonas aeruginosa]
MAAPPKTQKATDPHEKNPNDLGVSIERLQKHIYETQDPLSAVLKGHLFCEEIIDEIIFAHCRDTAPLKQAQLQFSTKLKIARSIYGYHMPQIKFPTSAWDAVERLTKLRNDMAHKIEGSQSINKIRELLIAAKRLGSKDLINSQNIISAEDSLDNIKCAIATIIGYLDAMKVVAIINRPESPQRKALVEAAEKTSPSQVAQAARTLIIPDKR